MRMSDWSSDVCSSDILQEQPLQLTRLRIRFVAPAIGGKQQGQPIGRLPFHLQAAAKRILPPQFRVACVILLPWSRNSRTARQANRDRFTAWPANVGRAIQRTETAVGHPTARPQ